MAKIKGWQKKIRGSQVHHMWVACWHEHPIEFAAVFGRTKKDAIKKLRTVFKQIGSGQPVLPGGVRRVSLLGGWCVPPRMSVRRKWALL